MKLSVIIPCHNAASTIGAQLEALAGQQWTEPWEVVVSDNGSTDATRAIVDRYKGRLPNLRVIDSSDRRGAAHARNAGALAATGDALAFCDADDVVAPGWVAAIGAALARYDFVASRFDTEQLNVSWLQKSHTNPQRDGLNQYKYPPYLPHAGGSGLGIKRSIHEAAGGFDEPMHLLEDTDYCWRIQLMGIPLHFASEAVINVRYPNTLGGIYRQARRYAEYNVLIYKKYQPLGMPRLSWKASAAAWSQLLQRLLRVRCKEDVARWVWNAGWRIGRLQGSIKYRILAL